MALRNMLSALEVFRVAGGLHHPVQLLAIFLYVAEHDGCLQQALTTAVGGSEASISRCLDRLGTETVSGKPGMRLIRRERDPEYYKRWKLFLTPKGRQIANLMEAYYHEPSEDLGRGA